jgi:hypothetical protein
LPVPCSGNFADVYEVRNATRAWAVKCFTREVAGLRQRYREISAFLGKDRLRFAVDFQYLDQGIRVRGQWYPVLKMDWVEGLLLNEFVRQHLDRPATLDALADLWARLARRLRRAGVAHGDLQHGNVLLVPGSEAGALALKLIDYDGMVVPALARVPSGEVGHPAYQHPQRLREGTYNAEVDRFPMLVIYVALRALVAGGRALWDRYDTGDNLLFRQQDLQAPGKSALFYELLKVGDPSVRLLAEQLIDAARKPLEQTPLLQELIASLRSPPAAGGGKSTVPGVAEAAETAAAPAPTWCDSSQLDGQPEPKWKGITPFWIALAGTVALLAVVVGLVLLMANKGARGSKKGPGLARGDTRFDKNQRARPDEEEERASPDGEAPQPENPVGSKGRYDPEEEAPPPKKPGGKVKKPAVKPKDPVGEIRRFIGHSDTGDAVVDVAFAPNGRTAVSGGQDKVLRLWDVETGEEIRRFEGHAEKVKCLCFTPDGLHVVSGSDDKTLRLWDVASGEEVRRFEGHTAGLGWFVAVTPDGRRIISYSGGPEKTVRIWDLKNGKELRRFGYQQAGAEEVGDIQAFSRDGRRALTAGSDNKLRLWNVDKGTVVRVLDEQSRGGTFSADGRFALAVGLDKYLRLYEVRSGKLVRRFRLGPAVGQLASFSPDGKRVLVSYDQQDYSTLWDVQSGEEIHRLEGNPKGAGRIRFSPDGKRALSAGRDGTVRLWGLPD